MREILFKGKLKRDNQFSSYRKKNQWIYGGVANIKEKSKAYIFDNDEKTLYEVISETVCQFTGLTDKNGVNIFEGDFDKDGNMVVWCDRCNGWQFAQIDVPTKDICIPCHWCDGNFDFSEHINDFVIVGNIHEKEL